MKQDFKVFDMAKIDDLEPKMMKSRMKTREWSFVLKRNGITNGYGGGGGGCIRPDPNIAEEESRQQIRIYQSLPTRRTSGYKENNRKLRDHSHPDDGDGGVDGEGVPWIDPTSILFRSIRYYQHKILLYKP